MRSVVEGVIPFEGEEEEEWNEERKGQVWLLEKGRLGVLKGGVGEYEKIAGKGVGKIGF